MPYLKQGLGFPTGIGGILLHGGQTLIILFVDQGNNNDKCAIKFRTKFLDCTKSSYVKRTCLSRTDNGLNT